LFVTMAMDLWRFIIVQLSIRNDDSLDEEPLCGMVGEHISRPVRLAYVACVTFEDKRLLS
jgi:hypothetical protein